MRIPELNKAKLKQKLINWSLLFITSSLGIIFLELAARKIIPGYYLGDQLRFTVDKDWFIRGVKNSEYKQTSTVGEFDVTVQFNEIGFRDKKKLVDADTSDYFALGDSYTFGWGIEEDKRFANLIENERVKVYNLAAPNDLVGYRNILKHCSRLGIDIQKLLIGICMENDLQLYEQSDLIPPTMTIPDTSMISSLKGWLKYNSCLYVFVTTQIKSSPRLKNALHAAGLVDKHKFTDKFSQLDSTVTSSVRLLNSVADGYETLILVIPSRFLWTGTKEAMDREAYLHQTFVEQLQSQGLDVIDLKPLMEMTGDPLQYHFPRDGHWNKKGHQLAADAIQNYLSKLPND